MPFRALEQWRCYVPVGLTGSFHIGKKRDRKKRQRELGEVQMQTSPNRLTGKSPNELMDRERETSSSVEEQLSLKLNANKQIFARNKTQEKK